MTKKGPQALIKIFFTDEVNYQTVQWFRVILVSIYMDEDRDVAGVF